MTIQGPKYCIPKKTKSKLEKMSHFDLFRNDRRSVLLSIVKADFLPGSSVPQGLCGAGTGCLKARCTFLDKTCDLSRLIHTVL